jgi:hypothetical protein
VVIGWRMAVKCPSPLVGLTSTPGTVFSTSEGWDGRISRIASSDTAVAAAAVSMRRRASPATLTITSGTRTAPSPSATLSRTCSPAATLDRTALGSVPDAAEDELVRAGLEARDSEGARVVGEGAARRPLHRDLYGAEGGVGAGSRDLTADDPGGVLRGQWDGEQCEHQDGSWHPAAPGARASAPEHGTPEHGGTPWTEGLYAGRTIRPQRSVTGPQSRGGAVA